MINTPISFQRDRFICWNKEQPRRLLPDFPIHDSEQVEDATYPQGSQLLPSSSGAVAISRSFSAQIP